MARAGEASILATADVSQFAAELQRELNSAIAGIRLDTDSLGAQITAGVRHGVEQANRELSTLGTHASTVAGTISSSIAAGGAAAASSVAASMRNAGAQMASIGQSMSMYVTLPLVTAGAVTGKTAGDFEAMMNRVKAATEATEPVFLALRKQAIDLGSTTAFSATEAADGMRILATAGFDTTEIMAALPAVLNMASAGAVTLGQAADIGSAILNGYGFAASDLAKVNDILARAFLSTATDLTDLGESFKYVAPVGKSAGIAFTEITAAIGLMGNAGIKGSEAGTALRGAIARMLSPTKEVSDTLAKLGVNVVDSSGKLLPLIDIVRQLEQSGADTADMMKIFGLEAGPAMQALLSQGSGALADLTTQLNNAGGTATRVANIHMQGLNGAIDELTSAAEGLMIAIGDAGLLGVLTDLTKGASELILELSQAPEWVLRTITVVAVLVAALGPVLVVVGKVAESIGILIPILKKAGTAFKAFGTSAVAFFATPAGWVVLAIAAVVAILVIAYQTSERFREVTRSAFAAVGQFAQDMWSGRIKPAFDAIYAGAIRFGQEVVKLRKQAQPVFTAIGKGLSDAWNSVIKPALSSAGSMLKKVGDEITSLGRQAAPTIRTIIGYISSLGQWISSWWSQNGDQAFRTAANVISWWWNNVTMPALRGFMAVLRAVGAVAVFIWQNVISPAIRVAIGIFDAVVTAAGRLWTYVAPVWQRIAQVVGQVVSFLIATFQRLWTIWGPVWGAIGAVISWMWNNVAMPVFRALGVAITAIGAVITWWWSNVVQPAFGGVVTVLTWVATAVGWFWGLVSMVFTAISTVITWWYQNVVLTVFQAVSAVFTWIGGVVSAVFNAVGAIFTWIGGVVSTIFGAIVGFISGAISFIVGIAGQVAGFASTLIGYFQSAADGVRSRIEAVINFVRGIPGAILNAIGNVGSILYEAGQNIINGLINGLTSRIGALREQVANAASTIRNALPFSPAKWGPLSGSGDPTIAGAKIMTMIADGMSGNISAIKDASVGMASMAGVGGLSPAIASVAPLSAGVATAPFAATAAVGNTYYLTVQSLDPKESARSVMDAIAAWERGNGKTWRS